MANYLKGESKDHIPAISTFEPDFNFFNQALNIQQQKYDTNWQNLNSIYNSVLNAPLTRLDNQEKRDEYFKSITNQMKQYAGTDLSKPQNFDAAENVFRPFYEDPTISKDIAWTRNFQRQQQTVDMLKNCATEECADKYWEGGAQLLAMQREEFANASPEDASRMQAPRYVENVNMTKEMEKIVSENDWNMEIDSKSGGYIVTTKGGKDMTEALNLHFNNRVKNDQRYKDFYNSKGELEYYRRAQSGEDVQNYVNSLISNEEVPKAKGRVSKANNEITKNDMRLNKLKQAYARGTYDKNAYEKRVAELQTSSEGNKVIAQDGLSKLQLYQKSLNNPLNKRQLSAQLGHLAMQEDIAKNSVALAALNTSISYKEDQYDLATHKSNLQFNLHKQKAIYDAEQESKVEENVNNSTEVELQAGKADGLEYENPVEFAKIKNKEAQATVNSNKEAYSRGFAKDITSNEDVFNAAYKSYQEINLNTPSGDPNIKSKTNLTKEEFKKALRKNEFKASELNDFVKSMDGAMTLSDPTIQAATDLKVSEQLLKESKDLMQNINNDVFDYVVDNDNRLKVFEGTKDGEGAIRPDKLFANVMARYFPPGVTVEKMQELNKRDGYYSDNLQNETYDSSKGKEILALVEKYGTQEMKTQVAKEMHNAVNASKFSKDYYDARHKLDYLYQNLYAFGKTTDTGEKKTITMDDGEKFKNITQSIKTHDPTAVNTTLLFEKMSDNDHIKEATEGFNDYGEVARQTYFLDKGLEGATKKDSEELIELLDQAFRPMGGVEAVNFKLTDSKGAPLESQYSNQDIENAYMHLLGVNSKEPLKIQFKPGHLDKLDQDQIIIKDFKIPYDDDGKVKYNTVNIEMDLNAQGSINDRATQGDYAKLMTLGKTFQSQSLNGISTTVAPTTTGLEITYQRGDDIKSVRIATPPYSTIPDEAFTEYILAGQTAFDISND